MSNAKPAAASDTTKNGIGPSSPSAAPKPQMSEVTDFDWGKVEQAGFEDITLPELEGWYKPEKGKGFDGKIVGRIAIPDARRGGDRDVVLVRLERPCSSCSHPDDSEQIVTLQPGQVLAVGIRYKLTELLEFVEHKGSCIVVASGKKSIGNGQTMWQFKIACKGKRAAPPAPKPSERRAPSAEGEVGEDDFPEGLF